MTNFGYRTDAADVVADIDLEGKRAVVTGAYSGIGQETARVLALAGADVTIACRDLGRAEAAAAELNAGLGAERIAAGPLDLADLSSVRRFVQEFGAAHEVLDILVNNAGVMACPREQTADGFEMQFGTNHLGHFALFNGLLPLLAESAAARVVCLSSAGHFISPVVFEDIEFRDREYEPWLAYGQSKTANALMAAGIQDRYGAAGIEAFAVQPGGIMTNLQRHMSAVEIKERGWVDDAGNVNEMFKTIAQGAATSVYAAVWPGLAGRGGRYLEDCAEAEVLDAPSEDFTGVMRYAVDVQNAERLWEVSESMIDAQG